MKVTLLGCSCGVPTKDRGLPSIAVRMEREIILFDCGEGTQRQMIKFGLSFMKIRRIFITHFHGDHYLGLFSLVQSMSFFGREEPLKLYGPQGMQKISGILGGIGNFTPGFSIVGHDLKSGDSVGCGGYNVSALAVRHTVPTLGYRLEEDERPGKFNLEKARSLGIPEGVLYKDLQNGKSVSWGGRVIDPKEVIGPSRPGRSIVYLGDVVPSDSVVSLSENADLLICEATFCDCMAERAEETGHSTVRQACDVAKRARVRKLLLTHFSPRYDRDSILEEVDFAGSLVGEDGLTIEVPFR